MPQCCIKRCKSKAGEPQNRRHGIRLHMLPNRNKSPQRYKKWLRFAERPDESRVKRFVCSLHFDASDLDEGAVRRTDDKLVTTGPRLKRTAVPSILVKDLSDRCFVNDCGRRSANKRPFPHRFDSPERFRSWVSFCDQNADPGLKSGICHRHFRAEDFAEDSTGQKHLLPGAVPTVAVDQLDTSEDETPWMKIVQGERRKVLTTKLIISSRIRKMFYASLNRKNKQRHAASAEGSGSSSDDTNVVDPCYNHIGTEGTAQGDKLVVLSRNNVNKDQGRIPVKEEILETTTEESEKITGSVNGEAPEQYQDGSSDVRIKEEVDDEPWSAYTRIEDQHISIKSEPNQETDEDEERIHCETFTGYVRTRAHNESNHPAHIHVSHEVTDVQLKLEIKEECHQ